MDTQALPTAKGQTDEWSVDDVVRSIRTGDGATHHARRWVVALGALVIAAVGDGDRRHVGRSAPTPRRSPWRWPREDRGRSSRGPAAPRTVAAPALAAGHGPASRGRSLVIVMPADRDYLSATRIPVAGIAFGRPHGPRIRAVRVALYVGEHLVDGMDLEVYAGRFAGVLALDGAIAMADAEIRVRNPANPAQAAEVRSITLDTPSTTR